MPPKKVLKPKAAQSGVSTTDDARIAPKKSQVPPGTDSEAAKDVRGKSLNKFAALKITKLKIPAKEKGGETSSTTPTLAKKKRITKKSIKKTGNGEVEGLSLKEEPSAPLSRRKNKATSKQKTGGVPSEGKISKKPKGPTNKLITTKDSDSDGNTLNDLEVTPEMTSGLSNQEGLPTPPPIGATERIFAFFNNPGRRVSDVEGGGALNNGGGPCNNKTLMIVGVVVVLVIFLMITMIIFVYAPTTQGAQGNGTTKEGSTTLEMITTTTGTTMPTPPTSTTTGSTLTTCQPRPTNTTDYLAAGDYCGCRNRVYGEDCSNCCVSFGFSGFEFIQCLGTCTS